jgi:hypothetical protein
MSQGDGRGAASALGHALRTFKKTSGPPSIGQKKSPPHPSKASGSKAVPKQPHINAKKPLKAVPKNAAKKSGPSAVGALRARLGGTSKGPFQAVVSTKKRLGEAGPGTAAGGTTGDATTDTY